MSVPIFQDDPRRQRQQNTQQRGNNPQQQQRGNNQQQGGNNQQQRGARGQQPVITEQPILDNEDSIPDSLLHPRWPIQRTTPITYDDLRQNPMDLKRPENMQQKVEYNDTIDRYVIGQKVSNTWLSAPIMMTPEEYMNYTTQQSMRKYFRSKNDEIYQTKGKENQYAGPKVAPVGSMSVEEQRCEDKDVLQPLVWAYQGDNLSIHVFAVRDRA